MPKMVVLSQTGKELNEITLADTVFGIEPNRLLETMATS